MDSNISGEQTGNILSMDLPAVIFGTSALGNLFVELSDTDKLNIVKECIIHSKGKIVFDTAGKYGAGLALETLGNCLAELKVKPEDVIISNKLGWLRTELKTEEPTFEPGVWKNLNCDAVQKISYDGIMECFEQGNKLLNGYTPQMVSVHDPDEYLSRAENKDHARELYEDILDGYDALYDLKKEGKVQSIGVGAKDWKVIKRIANDSPLDWVMIANSMTLYKHPIELLEFINKLEEKAVFVINSAVFHSGFLIGTDYFDYKRIFPDTSFNKALIEWREKFFEVCQMHSIKPAEACVQFALNVPGVKSIALNTSNAKRVKNNIEMAAAKIPGEFWENLKMQGLIQTDFKIKLERKDS